MTSPSKGEEDDIAAQAAEWHIASSGEDMDWDSFTSWLEVDQRHRVAYDEVALSDRLVRIHRFALRAAADADRMPLHSPATRKFRWLPIGLGAAVAAGLAIVVGPSLMRPADLAYTTAAASRTIALADGSSVVLAPRSRLVIAGGNRDALQLSGGAWFEIHHIAGRELAITAGPVTIHDIGTRFDVQANGSSVRVAVQGRSVLRS